MSTRPSLELFLDGRYHRRPDLRTKEVAGEILLLDQLGEEIHQLNVTARLIWEFCDGNRTPLQIIDCIMERFVVEEPMATQDVRQTMEHFLNHELIHAIERNP